MIQFFQTVMGKRFYEGCVPRIAKALETIGQELKRANDLKEQELPKEVSAKDIADEFRTDKKED